MNILYEYESELTGPIPVTSGSDVGSVVLDELAAWNGRPETDPAVYPLLSKYWEPIGIEWTPSGTPWSAAYISWVSAQGDRGFPSKAAHWQYVEAVLRGDVPGWAAYSISKNQGAVPIAVGDILVRPRGSGNPSTAEYWYTHGDVVGSIDGGMANLYGGNLSDTNKLAQRIEVDGDGIATGKIRDYVVILKREKKSPVYALGIFLIATVAGIAWITTKKK